MFKRNLDLWVTATATISFAGVAFLCLREDPLFCCGETVTLVGLLFAALAALPLIYFTVECKELIWKCKYCGSRRWGYESICDSWKCTRCGTWRGKPKPFWPYPLDGGK